MSSQQDDERGQPQDSDQTEVNEAANHPGDYQQRSVAFEARDPSINSGSMSESDWKSPEQAIAIETNQIRETNVAHSPSILVVPVEFAHAGERGLDSGSGKMGVGERGEKRANDSKSRSGRSSDEEGSADEKQGRDDVSNTGQYRNGQSLRSPESPSIMMRLLLPAVMSLICGFLGAWAYSHFLGSSKSSDQKTSSGDSDSGGQSGSGGHGNDEGQVSKGSGAADSGSKIGAGRNITDPGKTPPDQVISQENQHLAQQIESLSEQVEKLSMPRDETPPAVRNLEVKVTRLMHAAETLNGVPQRIQQLERRLDDVIHQLTALRERMPKTSGGSLRLPGVAVTGALAGDNTPASEGFTADVAPGSVPSHP